MYNFYVIEGKKLINYKPGYEQYTRAFTRVEEELEQKAEGISLEQLKDYSRSYLFEPVFIHKICTGGLRKKLKKVILKRK